MLALLLRSLRWPRGAALLLAAAYGALLVGGVLLLLAPAASTAHTTAADAFFTAVSALTLCGLAPLPTQEHWTLLGEGVIAALIFGGGLLYLLGATIALWFLGRRLGMRDEGMRRRFHGAPTLAEMRGVAVTVLVVALGAQAIGAIALFLTMLAADIPAGRALWWGPFHAVAAFNNAGFTLADGGYAAFAADLPVLLITGALALAGAVGPLPLAFLASRRTLRHLPRDADLILDAIKEFAPADRAGKRLRSPLAGVRFALQRVFPHLPLDTRVILIAVGGVLIAGAGVLLLGEWTNAATLAAEPGWRRPFLALFESSARTVGLTTLETPAFRDESKVFATGLMLIGGAAGSVSGGLKVGTFAVLAAGLLAALRGRERFSLLGRELPESAFRQALAIAFLYGATVIFLGAGMIAASRAAPLDALFEGISAISLSGWSAGVAAQAGAAERGLLITAMLVGRFAPILLVLQMARERPRPTARYAEGGIRFG